MKKIKQLEHHEIENQERKFPVSLIIDEIQSPANIGLLFRTAEAMGLENIYLNEDALAVGDKKFEKTARSTQKSLSYTLVPNMENQLDQLKNQGYHLFALEITNTSQNIRDINFRSFEKIALIIGGERHGVRQALLDRSDHCIAIPMYGKNSSMNVATATAIALYEIISQLNEDGNK